MAVIETALPVWAEAHGKREAASASGSINQASVYSVLVTALPSSLLAEALTDIAAVSQEIASDFAAGITPSWFASLPYPVKTYLEGELETTSSSPTVPSLSVPPQPPSSQATSSSSHQSTPVTTSSQQPTVPTSSSMTSDKQQSTLLTSNAPTTGTVPALLSSTTSAPALFSSTSSATPSPTSSPSSGPPTGAIAGGVVGGVAGLALIGVGAAFLLRRRKRRQRIEPVREVSFEPAGGGYGYH